MNARIRATILTLPAAGIAGVVGVLLRGPYALPIPDIDLWAQAASQPIFTVAQFLILIGYVAPFAGFWALYAHLRDQDVEKSAFWGFLLSIWGTTLALPALGQSAFAGPLAAEAYLAGDGSPAQLISDTITGAGFSVGITAAMCYIVGPLLLGIAIWRSGTLPRWAGLLFAAHGVCLSLGFGMFPGLILGWLLFLASGAGVTVRIWQGS